MGLYELSSLISDSRIRFLLAFLVFAIIVAVVLVYLEFKMKKREEVLESKSVDESYVSRVRRVVRSAKAPREKLDHIDKIVKKYFKENFGTNLNSNYSILIEEFKKTGRVDFIEFCELIFRTFYSSGSISEENVEEVSKSFINAIRRKEHEEALEKEPSFRDGLKKGLLAPFNFIQSKIEAFRRFSRRNKRIRRHNELVRKREQKKKQIEEENNMLKAAQERREQEAARKKALEIKQRERALEIKQREHMKEVVKKSIFKGSSEDHDSLLKKRVPFNFGKSKLLKDENLEPQKTQIPTAPVESKPSQPSPAVKQESERVIVPGLKPEELKMMKDSFRGDFEMIPPVNKKKSSDVLGGTLNS